ncbi:MAG TPA: ribose-5-phosphate isomerase RpiA [Aggregatilineales bacterium]|nr:ribose-5-phosphate isomerase RpiA [Aggregatilineales bacterium]
MTDLNELKRQAGIYAADQVQSGMVVGLGHGSTAIHAVRRIAERIQSGDLSDILGIPCSAQVEADARALGIPLTTLEQHSVIDLTIDGADEVDPNLELIKGGGGALTREKIVAQASEQEIIIVDHSKLVPALGTGWAIPIEVIPFGYGSQQAFLEDLGASVKVRQKADGSTFITDQGNIILDARFGPLPDPAALATLLKARTGIVEHGLFIGLATQVIVAETVGIRMMKRS